MAGDFGKAFSVACVKQFRPLEDSFGSGFPAPLSFHREASEPTTPSNQWQDFSSDLSADRGQVGKKLFHGSKYS
jgi:hypothetical protein